MTESPYETVRGVRVPKQQIENIEREFGAKLVPETEGILLKKLDLTLAGYRSLHDKDPKSVVLLDYPGEMFKHMNLNVGFMGLSLEVTHKPAWFRFKKSFRVL